MIPHHIHVQLIGAIKSWEPIKSSTVEEIIRATATITAFASAILCSTLLAHHRTPMWCISTLSASMIHVCSFKKLLQNGNNGFTKALLLTNVAAINCLLLGAMSSSCLFLTQAIVHSFKHSNFSTILFHTFLLTGLVGYGSSFCLSACKSIYRFLNNSQIKKRLSVLLEHLQSKKQISQHYLVYLTLFQSDLVLKFCHTLDISLPENAWPIVTATSNRISLSQFNKMLAQAIEAPSKSIDFFLEELSEDIDESLEKVVAAQKYWTNNRKNDLHTAISIALQAIDKQDIPEAVKDLITKLPTLIPTALSNDQFLHLFKGEILDEANKLVNAFVRLMSQWKKMHAKYQQFCHLVNQLKCELEGSTKQQVEQNVAIFKKRQKSLSSEFCALRFELNDIYQSKRIWHNYSPLWKGGTQLPFKEGQKLVDALQNQGMLKEIDDIYRALMGVDKVYHELEFVGNRLRIVEEDEDLEKISSIMFLAANCGFIQQDFTDLQSWLHLDSPHDLEMMLEKIGLVTEEDLYTHNILSCKHPGSSKEEIRKNLKEYINRFSKHLLAQNLTDKKTQEIGSSLQKISIKTSRAIYFVIKSGFLLVPILIHKQAGAVGFMLGCGFFTLVRFGIPAAEIILETTKKFFDDNPVGVLVSALFNRRIYPLSNFDEEITELFVNGHLFLRAIMINFHVTLAILVSSFNMKFGTSTFPCGSFLQGIALSRDIVSVI